MLRLSQKDILSGFQLDDSDSYANDLADDNSDDSTRSRSEVRRSPARSGRERQWTLCAADATARGPVSRWTQAEKGRAQDNIEAGWCRRWQ